MTISSPPNTHVLKVQAEYFEAIVAGRKPWEVRFNDRGYQVGDTLYLQEINGALDSYTGRSIRGKVSYIYTSEIYLAEGVSILSVDWDFDDYAHKAAWRNL